MSNVRVEIGGPNYQEGGYGPGFEVIVQGLLPLNDIKALAESRHGVLLSWSTPSTFRFPSHEKAISFQTALHAYYAEWIAPTSDS